MRAFEELTSTWFERRFGEPTVAQRLGWPSIQAGEDTLIAAPTGSGKTLAAFLVSLDQLIGQALRGTLEDSVHTVYVSPLKALSNDIERNLQAPLSELSALASELYRDLPPIRVGLRTGDTPANVRQSMVRRPPHILVTTPESLYMLLTSEKARGMLRNVNTVIVDEIHALARDKRGSHLSLSLERLDSQCARLPVRVGLSATQRPIERIAGFLVGAGRKVEPGVPRCRIVDVGHVRKLDLDVEVPTIPLGAVATREHWSQVHDRLVQWIESHRSTLVFVNTRRMAERVSFALSERLGKEAVCSHHGSLSKETRLETEQRLRSGELKAIVATASLELGIDVGCVDFVCQLGSPRSIATLLQRVGRSGHTLGAVPKGRIVALTRDDLIESLALIRAIRRGILDAVEIPSAPLDILAQQVIAAAAVDEWNESELFELVRRAWPYRDLARTTFDALLESLSSARIGNRKLPVRLHRDRIHGRVRSSRGARIIATASGGAIPDNADYRVVSTDGSVVGGVNEDFAIESMSGDVFLLGTTSWRIVQVRGLDVIVEDAHGAPPSIPFWFGEAPGRTAELSDEVSEIRREVADRISNDRPTDTSAALDWLCRETATNRVAAEQAVTYIAAQKVAMGVVPTGTSVVFERFFDETEGMQLVIHAPFGSRVNRGWGLALRKRFCRSFDFELQASADDNGIVLSLGPQHSFPIEDLFTILSRRNARHMLEQASLDSPVFRIRWRWNSTRALLVLRQRGGMRVPPALQRFRSDDALTAIFPASTACLENRPEDITIPDHPIVQQTIWDCLHEAADFERWTDILGRIERGEITLDARDTTEPSPFAHERLNAMPYAFLDDAPLEERRARAVSYRRSFSLEEIGDLAQLDPEAIRIVCRQAWPLPRSADELHETLLQMYALRTAELCPTDVESELAVPKADCRELFRTLVESGRASVLTVPNGESFAIAAERWPALRAVYPTSFCDPPVVLPECLSTSVDEMDGRTALVRGRMEVSGPISSKELATILSLPAEQVEGGLARLEGEGVVLRGRFDPSANEVQWCDRRLLARIHRRTLEGARRRVQPVSTAEYQQFLLRHQGLLPNPREKVDRNGPVGVFEAISQLAGIEAPAGAWEQDILPARVRHYESGWLDELSFTGAISWGRLVPPVASTDRKRLVGLSRVVPISIFPRNDLSWLLPPSRVAAEDKARSNAHDVWLLLRDRGALFHNDLLVETGLLPSQLDDALGELAALGLVTADGFAGIRALVAPKRAGSKWTRNRRSLRGQSYAMARSISGRWSIFPPAGTPSSPDRIDRWARLLLHRYGVVFRDLLERESVAPPWWELVRVYRLMEARGEVHGGRFVGSVGFEQYALPGVVDQLRRIREETDDGRWIVLSAADPLNLTGILDSGPRVAATRGNSIAMRGGKVIARSEGGAVSFVPALPSELRESIARRMALAGASRWRAAHDETETTPVPQVEAISKNLGEISVAATGMHSPRSRLLFEDEGQAS